ncbi:hypothetical protein A2U01_0082422, partial [Trifolium medium]|nr:hypothetical protein [Trifolium medium]
MGRWRRRPLKSSIIAIIQITPPWCSTRCIPMQ